MEYDRTRKYKDDYGELSLSDKQKAKSLYPLFLKFVETGDIDIRKRLDIHVIDKNKDPVIWSSHLESNLVFTFQYLDGPNGQTVLFRRIGKERDVYYDP